MSSDKKTEANRLNAQKSTGPRTEEGKKRSSQNARRHGITAQTTVNTEEDRIHHDAFCQAMMTELAPVGVMETFLASSVAEEAWRLHHSRAACNNIVAIGHFDGTGDRYETNHAEIHTAITGATVIRDGAKTFELLSLYQQRIQRAFQKYFEQLRQLQAERKAKRAEDLEEARNLSQLAILQNLPYEPKTDGFDFSNAEIDNYRERYYRLRLAKNESLTYRQHAGVDELCKDRAKIPPDLPKAA
jgi:hypothetical protein